MSWIKARIDSPGKCSVCCFRNSWWKEFDWFDRATKRRHFSMTSFTLANSNKYSSMTNWSRCSKQEKASMLDRSLLKAATMLAAESLNALVTLSIRPQSISMAMTLSIMFRPVCFSLKTLHSKWILWRLNSWKKLNQRFPYIRIFRDQSWHVRVRKIS